MMGRDVERILLGINEVKCKAVENVILLSNALSYQVTSDARHGGESTGECISKEKEVPIDALSFVNPIREAMETISDDFIKMESLASGLYTNINSFNNGCGSPWTELSNLNSVIINAELFASSHSELNWVSEKSALIGLLNVIVSEAVDAKWAIINYHDYIQRGYDNKYNNNEPSIKFIDGINKKSIGNINHEYHENVNIKKESIDPF